VIWSWGSFAVGMAAGAVFAVVVILGGASVIFGIRGMRL
jgi:hypothetical protein